jgi:hypothetical protein
MAGKNSIFTDNLKRIILDSGLDNRTFSDKAKIGYSTLMTYLNKKNYGHVAEWDILIKLSEYCGKSIEWFLTGTEKTSSCDNSANCPLVNCNDHSLIEKCKKVKNVIESKTEYSGALKENIDAFNSAVEERKKAVTDKHKSDNEIRNLKTEMKNIKAEFEKFKKISSLKANTDTD